MSSEMAEDEAPLQLFEVCLHQEEYFPGEVVAGKLLLVTSRPLKTEGIYLKFEGRGSVRWKSRSAHLCGLQKAEFVQEKRKYFSNVFRYDLDSLPEGSSVLTFDFELPTGIPQSIEASTIMKQLTICYSLEVLVRTGGKDYRQEKGFTVKGILNLNAYPEISHPICKTVKEAVFESCWSSSGRVVVISFSTKKQGFVPGEQIKTELVLQDGYKGETPLLGVEVHLIQEIELKIRTASKIRRRVVTKSEMMHVTTNSKSHSKIAGESRKHEQKRKFNFFLTIPEDCLITYGNTDKQVHDFISIQYFLRMTIEQTSFPYNPLQLHLPIKIGTVFIKEQKVRLPILLLAPVPLVLPRPKLPLEEDYKQNNNNAIDKNQEHLSSESNPPVTPVIPLYESVPEIVITSKCHFADLDKPKSLSNNASPRTPKHKLGLGINSNTVGDSSSSLYKPVEAFGGYDSDSDSQGSDSNFAVLDSIFAVHQRQQFCCPRQHFCCQDSNNAVLDSEIAV